jgi:hypothetical protein
MTEKLTLELALVLPGIPDERDACIARMTELLQAQGVPNARHHFFYEVVFSMYERLTPIVRLDY